MSENTHSTSKNLADEMARRRGRRYPAHTWIAEKFPDYVKVLVELDEVIRLKPRRFDQKMHELFHIVALARHQIAVGNIQFLRSMIPHQSSAILMCQEAEITDPDTIVLCRQILRTQRDEIEQMEKLLARLRLRP